MRNVEIDNLVKSKLPHAVQRKSVMNLNASKLIADYDKIIDIELTGTFVARSVENIKGAESRLIQLDRELLNFLAGRQTMSVWSTGGANKSPKEIEMGVKRIKASIDSTKKVLNNSKYNSDELDSIHASRSHIIQVLQGGNDPHHIFRAIDPSQNASFYEMIKKMSFYRNYEIGEAIKKGKADEAKRLQLQQEAISFAKGKANEQNAKDRRELQDKVNKAMRNDPDSNYGRIVEDMQKEIAQARTAPSANSVFVGLIGGGEIHQDTDDDTNVDTTTPKDEDIIPTATGIGTIALIGGLGYLLYRGIK